MGVDDEINSYEANNGGPDTSDPTELVGGTQPGTDASLAEQPYQGEGPDASMPNPSDMPGATPLPGEQWRGSAPKAPGMPATATDPQGAALAARDAGMDEAKAQAGVGAAENEKRQFEAQAADDRRVQQEADHQENLDRQAAQQAALDKTQAEVAKAQEDYQSLRPEDHLANMPAANKVMALIFAGIGGIAQARGLGPNQTLVALDAIARRDADKYAEGLKTRETMVKWKQQGETDMRSRFDKENARADLIQSHQLQAMADAATSQYMRTHPGATPDDAKNDVLVKGLEAKAATSFAAFQQKTYAVNAVQETKRLGMKKASGGASGGVPSGGVTELVKMAEDGQPLSAIAKRAGQLGVKSKDYLPMVKDVQGGQARDTGAAEKKAASEDARTVRNGDGSIAGLAPSTRMVKLIQDRNTNFDDAIDSLEKLQKTKGMSLPFGSDYDRAVLAVAATTTANASDTTTKHEAGTLKNYGLVSGDAIDETLHHLKKRKAAFLKQLQPLASDDAAPAAKDSHPQDSAAVSWAKANPGDPRAAKILALNGAQ